MKTSRIIFWCLDKYLTKIYFSGPTEVVTIVVFFSRRILHGDPYFLVFLKFASHTRLACLAAKQQSIFANERT